MVYQNIMVEIYQAASPAVGERLFDDDMLKDIYYICEEIFQKNNRGVLYPSKDVEEYFEEFHTIISFFKHIEITLDFVDLEWSALLDELIQEFPQVAWIGGSKEQEENRVVYYIDFVPIAYRNADFPFMVNLMESMCQQMEGTTHDNVLRHVVIKIEEMVSQFIKPLEQVADDEPEETVDVIEHEKNDVDSAGYLLAMEEAVNKERNAKERIQLANKKLELIIDQMERQSLSRAIAKLNQQANKDNEDWDRIVKVDLREYSQLLQKAKFLEQTWVMNKELMTKSEKMFISDNLLTYEREQINSFKNIVSSNEIYLILDECKLIESRVKIKKRSWFSQPHVRIMKMDYDSILNKAAYFDLIQGENYLLEKVVLDNEKISELEQM